MRTHPHHRLSGTKPHQCKWVRIALDFSGSLKRSSTHQLTRRKRQVGICEGHHADNAKIANRAWKQFPCSWCSKALGTHDQGREAAQSAADESGEYRSRGRQHLFHQFTKQQGVDQKDARVHYQPCSSAAQVCFWKLLWSIQVQRFSYYMQYRGLGSGINLPIWMFVLLVESLWLWKHVLASNLHADSSSKGVLVVFICSWVWNIYFWCCHLQWSSMAQDKASTAWHDVWRCFSGGRIQNIPWRYQIHRPWFSWVQTDYFAQENGHVIPLLALYMQARNK